jgi:hypothetical protein
MYTSLGLMRSVGQIETNDVDARKGRRREGELEIGIRILASNAASDLRVTTRPVGPEH